MLETDRGKISMRRGAQDVRRKDNMDKSWKKRVRNDEGERRGGGEVFVDCESDANALVQARA
jgi:hypothetical protein